MKMHCKTFYIKYLIKPRLHISIPLKTICDNLNFSKWPRFLIKRFTTKYPAAAHTNPGHMHHPPGNQSFAAADVQDCQLRALCPKHCFLGTGKHRNISPCPNRVFSGTDIFIATSQAPSRQTFPISAKYPHNQSASPEILLFLQQ